MRFRPQYLIWVVVGVVLGGVLVYVATAEQPGKRIQTGNVITKTLGTANGNATASFDIALQEGGDAEHEADHVFEALANQAVASASLDVENLRLDVRFDDAQATESDIRRLLVASGYVKATVDDAVPATLSADGKSQEIKIDVSDKLEPALVRASPGIPLRLVFGEGTDHLSSITIEGLGVQLDLTQGGAAAEVPDPKPGSYDIVCAEGYADGTLIVE